MLAAALAAAGLFAAIYHPIGTAMLVDAAGDKPGRAIGINGVFGNFGVALAPVVTAFLAAHGRLARGLHRARARWRCWSALLWLRWPGPTRSATAAAGRSRRFPRHLVRRAVVCCC